MSVMNVQIIVAVDEMGNVECIPHVPYHSTYTMKSDAFLKEKKDSPRKWQISYLKATVPVPTEPIIEAEVAKVPNTLYF